MIKSSGHEKITYKHFLKDRISRIYKHNLYSEEELHTVTNNCTQYNQKLAKLETALQITTILRNV